LRAKLIPSTAAGVTYACGTRNDNWAWRIPLAVQWSVPALMLLTLPFIPESPWHLVRKGKMEEARKALVRLYWLSGDDVDQHLARIDEVVLLEAHNKDNGTGTYLDLFRRTNLRRTIVVAVVFMCQEFAGVQFVLGFSTYFFQLAGFPVAQSFKLNIGTLSLAFVGNLIGLSLINRVGRRRLFIVGMCTCAADCLGLAICSMIPGQAALWGQASFTMIYMLAFQSGIGPVAYALVGELGSAKLRAKTVGWGMAVHNTSVGELISSSWDRIGMQPLTEDRPGTTQVILPYLVNPDQANLKGKVGWIFFGVAVVGAIWAYFFVPETAHRNIDELDELFARGIPARKFHKTELGLDRSAAFETEI
jgi:SP family general alpha glucoside:H+ symporter-like MFS transporter